MATTTLKIPVGEEPHWETEEVEEEAPLNSVFNSSALHYALRQSRNAWLSSVFPKFTSKSKTKGQKDIVQPPHNLRFISKCDIEIGPHIFPETSVYEAHYLSEPSHYATGFPSTYSQSSIYSQTTSGTYTYPLTSFTPYVAPANPRASSSAPLSGPAPSVEPPDPSLDVTPALIAQVNEAAATNPTLHNLLQVAAAGEASLDQLRTLGFFIQSLATAQQRTPPVNPLPSFSSTQSTSPQSAFMQAAKYSPPHATPKRPNLVLEFRENHTERVLVPREIVACEQEVPPSQTFRKDIVLYTFVPFVNDETKYKAGATASSRTPTIIRFLNVSDAIWETIRGWVNEEAKSTDAWDSFYDKVETSSPRVYLQYRLPNSDLLSQLHTACNNGYTMKSIKPSSVPETTSNKRSRSRKAASQTSKNTKTFNDVDGTSAQADSSVQESAPRKETATKRRKSSTKVGPAVPTGTTGGLYFINTMAPPPAPLQLYPEAQSAPVPATTSTEPVPQAT